MCLETKDGIKKCRLIAVHAGLEEGKDIEEQLKFLKAKETKFPKIMGLSGRKNVWNIPKVIILGPIWYLNEKHNQVLKTFSFSLSKLLFKFINKLIQIQKIESIPNVFCSLKTKTQNEKVIQPILAC